MNAQGEDVVSGVRTPQPIEEMQQRLPEAFEQLRRDDGAARAALPRHAGHRVHGRGGPALPPADALGEAHRSRGSEGGGRHDGGRAHLARGGDRPHRLRPARPAAAPDDRPEGRGRGGGTRSQRVARSGLRCDRPRRRQRRRARQGRRVGDPRPLGDDAGRHPRVDPVEGRADRARRHDVARRGRRARHGEAVRRRLRRARDRPGRAHAAHRRPRSARGRHDHDRRRHRPRDPRPRRTRAAADQRGLRDGARAGPTRCAA